VYKVLKEYKDQLDFRDVKVFRVSLEHKDHKV
jgi:hypothetical protein